MRCAPGLGPSKGLGFGVWLSNDELRTWLARRQVVFQSSSEMKNVFATWFELVKVYLRFILFKEISGGWVSAISAKIAL